MTLSEAQYQTIMQALSEARDLAAEVYPPEAETADQVATHFQAIADKIREAYELLESEHYPPEVERDDLRPDANYKPGASSDFPF